MNNAKTILLSLLVVQLLIAGGLYLNSHQDAEFEAARDLIASEVSAFNKVEIFEGDESVVLEKSADAWRVPALSNLPADTEKVDEVLRKLGDTQVSWPVASSSASRERFEVSGDKFQRKIVLHDDAGEHTLYLGTSPGYRSVHARLAEESNIYAVKLAAHDFPVKALDWLDKTLLRLSDVRRLKGPDYELAAGADKEWAFVAEGASAETMPALDKEKANALVSVFKNIRIQDLADKAVLDQAAEKSTIEVVVIEEKDTWTYRFAKAGERYFVTRNDLSPVFEIRDVDYEKIAQASRDYLAAGASATSDAEADSSAAAVDEAVNVSLK